MRSAELITVSTFRFAADAQVAKGPQHALQPPHRRAE